MFIYNKVGESTIAQEIRSSTLLEGKISVMQDISPLPLKDIKDKKRRPNKEADTDNN